MATITFTIPAGITNRVVNTFAQKHGWTDTVEGANGSQIPNPVSAGQFVKDWFRNFIIAEVKSEEDRIAKASASSDVSVLNTITVT